MKILVDSCVFIDSFDPQSPNHKESLRLLETFRSRNQMITMPAHAWFEVQCTLQRLSMEGGFVGPTFLGQQNYPLELIHIDDSFIKKYAMADIPYIKGSDHIFIAIAKLDNYPLITSDAKMTKVSRQCNIRVFSPAEFLKQLGNKI